MRGPTSRRPAAASEISRVSVRHAPGWTSAEAAWRRTPPLPGPTPSATGSCEAMIRTAAAGTKPSSSRLRHQVGDHAGAREPDQDSHDAHDEREEQSEGDVLAAAGHGEGRERPERQERGDRGRSRLEVGGRGERSGGEGRERRGVETPHRRHPGQLGVRERLGDENQRDADARQHVAGRLEGREASGGRARVLVDRIAPLEPIDHPSHHERRVPSRCVTGSTRRRRFGSGRRRRRRRRASAVPHRRAPTRRRAGRARIRGRGRGGARRAPGRRSRDLVELILQLVDVEERQLRGRVPGLLPGSEAALEVAEHGEARRAQELDGDSRDRLRLGVARSRSSVGSISSARSARSARLNCIVSAPGRCSVGERARRAEVEHDRAVLEAALASSGVIRATPSSSSFVIRPRLYDLIRAVVVRERLRRLADEGARRRRRRLRAARGCGASRSRSSSSPCRSC